MSPASKKIGPHVYLSHCPQHSVFHGDTLCCCPPAASVAEEGVWCRCSTSLPPSSKATAGVMLFPCSKAYPLHFGRLHDRAYLQLFSTGNPHLFVCVWFCASVRPYGLSSDHLFSTWGLSWPVRASCYWTFSNAPECHGAFWFSYYEFYSQ